MVKFAYRISFDKTKKGRVYVGGGTKPYHGHPYNLYTKRAAEKELVRMKADSWFFKNPKIEKVKL